MQFSIDEVQVYWEPKDYLFAWADSPSKYCLGAYNNGSGYSVLGANFMRGKDVIFDRTNERIGFANADWSVVNRHRFLSFADLPSSEPESRIVSEVSEITNVSYKIALASGLSILGCLVCYCFKR